MTDYPYDPELPFVVTIGGILIARVKSESIAAEIAHGHLGRVVDTTPAPKIPADAEFIYWMSEDKWEIEYYARKVGTYWLTDQGYEHDIDELLAKIGDDEVVVLKRA